MSAIMKACSRGVDYLERGLYLSANTTGTALQVVSGLFLTHVAFNRYNGITGNQWLATKNSLQQAYIIPTKGAADFAGLDPTVLATCLFATGTALRLLGRSTDAVKQLDKLRRAEEAYTEAHTKNSSARTAFVGSLQNAAAAQEKLVAALKQETELRGVLATQANQVPREGLITNLGQETKAMEALIPQVRALKAEVAVLLPQVQQLSSYVAESARSTNAATAAYQSLLNVLKETLLVIQATITNKKELAKLDTVVSDKGRTSGSEE